jgi:hypothetical protein
LGQFSLENCNDSDNLGLGYLSGNTLASGEGNIFIGRDSGKTIDGHSNNTMVGRASGQNITQGSFNSFFGYAAGAYLNGTTSVAIGYRAGPSTLQNIQRCVFLGPDAGRTETSSNRLHIANVDTKTLIFGNFNLNLVRINHTLDVIQEVQINSTKVIGAQAAAEADVTGTADAVYSANEQTMLNDIKATINSLLAKLRTHGLIAT